MKHRKAFRVLFLVLAAVMLLVSAAALAACGGKKREQFDILVKVRSSRNDEWIFDFETDELSCEYAYTGEGIDFRVASCNMPNHSDPNLQEDWIAGGWGIGFKSGCVYSDTHGNRAEGTEYRPALERGTYVYSFEPDGVSKIIKYRKVYLTVVIK